MEIIYPLSLLHILLLIQYSTSSPCSVTIAFCTSCSMMDSTDCKSCEVGYGLSGNTCPACTSMMNDCIECTTSTSCQKCRNDSFILDSSSFPDRCVPCSTYLTNCATCRKPMMSPYQCIACIDNTFAVKTADQKCYTCLSLMPNCLTCSS